MFFQKMEMNRCTENRFFPSSTASRSWFLSYITHRWII